MLKVDPEKVKANFTTSEALFTKYYGPPGSPEREKMHDDAMKWFYGEVLRDRRKELKITQAELAQKTGMKQSYLARLEKGQVYTFKYTATDGTPKAVDVKVGKTPLTISLYLE